MLLFLTILRKLFTLIFARVIGGNNEQLAVKMTELNDLFEQIFHSERNFKEKIEQLKTCKLYIYLLSRVQLINLMLST